MIRNPCVAGQFYPRSKDALLNEVRALVGSGARKESAFGIVSPHAGYMYSGFVAGSIFASITPKPVYVIMGPNHTGIGEVFGLDPSESWKTPLGEVKIDKALAARIKDNCKDIKDDDLSHAHEHSIEVQLPFLQYLQKDFKFVPITVSYAALDSYKKVGKAIAKSVKDLKLEKDVTIIASSDMTHYESQDSAKKKDAAAIEAVLELNEDKLIRNIAELDISMCGYGPTAIMIVAAKELGAKGARLVKYQTSGDVTGDYSSVVGYAGIIVT